MRLVLVNPHTFEYGNLISGFVFHRRMVLKYDFFLEFYTKAKEEKVAFYIDGTRNSFNVNLPFGSLLFSYLELFIWMLANKINPFRVKVYSDIHKLDPKKDVLFTFARSIVNVSEKNSLKMKFHEFQGLVIIHFTHYFQKIEKLAKYVRKIPNCLIVAENDLTNIPFFNQYFPFIKTVYQLPFVFSERFVVQEHNFEKRLNKCIAIGTPCPAEGKSFFDFFKGGTTLQPMRRILYEKHQEFPNEIDSLIKEFLDPRILKKTYAKDSFFIKLAKKIFPYVVLEKIIPIPQKEYFKFDIVEKYNQYRMFVCPEEIIGLPSVNVFEGMACGCTYFGIDSPMYRNLGMVPGVHYVAYQENNIDDLVSQVRYYQDQPEELKRISEKGSAFVRNNFNKKNIAEIFWNDLEKIQTDFSGGNANYVHCGFSSVSDPNLG